MSYLLASWIPGINGRPKPIELPENAACADFEGDGSLAHILATSRERLGYTREAAAAECHLQLSYVEMMETGNYGAIPDMLYLLPAFRRYAEFLGLDEKEVTAIFMHDFEESENAVTPVPRLKSSRTIKLPSLRSLIAVAGVAGAVTVTAIAGATLGHRKTVGQPASSTAAVHSPATASSPVVAAVPLPVLVASNRVADSTTHLAAPVVHASTKHARRASASIHHRRSLRTARHARAIHRRRHTG